VSQGTLKEVACRGTQFQDTANIIEKIYPKRLSELKARSNSPGSTYAAALLLLHDPAYLYRVWITLIKLSYTPLQGCLSDPDIHLAE
jgi:hypothetical protein